MQDGNSAKSFSCIMDPVSCIMHQVVEALMKCKECGKEAVLRMG